ncbi:CAP domain-containing protein [Profundibacter sp.]
MSKKLITALVFLSATFLFTLDAEACSRRTVPGSDKLIMPERHINETLLDAAVRVEVNYFRCRAGLRPVRSDSGLRKLANGHSKWMARARNMSHTSTVSGRRTLGDRLKRSGIRWKAAAENIGMVHRFQLEAQRFYGDSSSCQFTNSSGHKIQPHSYKSLARYIVKLWMGSPGHRHNIMDQRMTKVGTAIALDRKAKYCGTYYITQNFAQ